MDTRRSIVAAFTHLISSITAHYVSFHQRSRRRQPHRGLPVRWAAYTTLQPPTMGRFAQVSRLGRARRHLPPVARILLTTLLHTTRPDSSPAQGPPRPQRRERHGHPEPQTQRHRSQKSADAPVEQALPPRPATQAGRPQESAADSTNLLRHGINRSRWAVRKQATARPRPDGAPRHAAPAHSPH